MITGKQRGYLRGLANPIPAIFQIGKNGVEENSIRQFNDALEARELVKASVLKTSPVDVKEVAVTLAEALEADVVQVLGNKFVLYRESRNNKMIELP